MLAGPALGKPEVEVVFIGDQVFLREVVPSSNPSQPAFNREEITLEILAIANEERVRFGLKPLLIHPGLQMAALSHAREMQELRYFSHTSPTSARGTTRQRVQLYGYNPKFISENIFECSGYDLKLVPAFAARALLESPEHRKNLLNPEVTHVGVGLAVTGDSVSLSQVFAYGFEH